jgi:DNA-binding MarR family transcriptional regulator
MLTFACELTYAETDPGDATQQDKASRMNHRLVYLLNVGQRRLHRWSQARTGAGGVTAAQAGLLFFLAKNDGALMSEAAAALDLGAPGMSGLVDRAERAGFVQRHADEFDRRASRLWLTEDGRAAGKRSKSGLADLNARLTDGFTASEIDVVARWLTSLQEKFPATEEDAAWPREPK